MRIAQIGLLFLSVLVLTFVTSCKKEVPEPEPKDGFPAIRRIAPAQLAVLQVAGQVQNVEFLLADNEKLARLDIYELVLQNVRYEDTTMAADTLSRQLIYTDSIEGKSHSYTLPYTVPALDTFSRIELWAVVTDSKGQQDSTQFIITVDFARTDQFEDKFSILSYTNDSIYNRVAANGMGAFNLVARQFPTPTNNAAKDIEETTTVNGNFDMAFTSPNNDFHPVFVVLKPSVFNYNALNYTTMRQAYYSNFPSTETSKLEEGDIVIMKMKIVHFAYPQYNHFAAIKINKIVQDAVGDNDRIYFDYKRSQDKP